MGDYENYSIGQKNLKMDKIIAAKIFNKLVEMEFIKLKKNFKPKKDEAAYYLAFGKTGWVRKSYTQEDIFRKDKNNMKNEQKIDEAVKIAINYGSYDGGHHKMWVIDQMLRILAGDNYKAIIEEICDGEDGPNTYSWNCGVPP